MKPNNSKNSIKADVDDDDDDYSSANATIPSLFHGNMRYIMNLRDELADCGINTTISLPRIVVMGTQSSGKSSLLESIVGFDFLPRGEGVVTRRPLELRLHREKELEVPYAVFQDEPLVKYEIKNVEEQINLKTDKVAGKRKGIVDSPLVLTIYAKSCPDLTLIDLPGITKIPVKESDQGEDIEEITTKMTWKYINDTRTIILCVIPANTDISTSDSLKIARKTDPDGLRTLGVLTKVDIMDKGSNCLDVLNGNVIPLRHGYIAVKNRSKQDIDRKVPVKEALKLEMAFFQEKKIYSQVMHLVGTRNLSEKLSRLLYDHILQYLPFIEQEIDASIHTKKTELESYGEVFPTEPHAKMEFILRKNSLLQTVFKSYMDASLPQADLLFSGFTDFRLNSNDFYQKIYNILVKETENSDMLEVMLDLLDSQGISPPGFLSIDTFCNRVKHNLIRINDPANKFIQNIYKMLNDRLKRAVHEVFGTVPMLADEVLKATCDYLGKLVKDTTNYVDMLIECEKKMIYTNVKDFLHTYTRKSDDDKNVFNKLAQAKTMPQSLSLINTEQNESLTALDLFMANIEKKVTKAREILLSIGSGKDPKSFTGIKNVNVNKLTKLKTMNIDVDKAIPEKEILLFMEKIYKYYEIISRNLGECISKIVGAKCMIDFMENISDPLINLIANKDFIDNVKSDKVRAEKREMCSQILKKLTAAKDLFSRGFEINASYI